MSSRRDFLKSLPLAASAGLAGAAQPRRPNILLLFPDQHRFDFTGANPAVSTRTPNLDALAGRGVRFTRAICASPLCAPSRACLASGREYERCGVKNNGEDYPLDLHKKSKTWGLDGKGSLAEWGFSDGIDNAGKRDAMSGAVTPQDPYMAYLHERSLAAEHVADFARRKNYAATFPTPLPDDAYCDNWVARNGLELMRRFPAGRPWHLAVNFTGPHEPMDITASMEKRWRGAGFPQPNRNTQFPPETHVAIRENYSAMIENIDRWVGVYVEAVRKRGELDNTLVVFSSDHGEMLGDHNRWGKAVPFQPSVGVPMVIAGPGVRHSVSEALVSTMDLAATFLEYAGVGVPSGMDSRSLGPLLQGRARSHREHVLSGLNRWRMVYDGRYKLIVGFDPALPPQGDPAPILFDLERDPLENEDIAAAAPEHVRRLMPLLGRGRGIQ
jgi:arylsulfatase A-like enzyme